MKNLFIFILLSLTVPASAIKITQDTGSIIPVKLPLADIPYNFSKGYTFPGMNQSLCITKDFSQLSHNLVFHIMPPEQTCLQMISIFAWDYLLFYLPGGPAWLHEEWHRAVMGQYGVSSYNDIYNMDIFSEIIAVSHVKDNGLAMIKNDHNSDMVRLSAAGYEADIELTKEFRRDSFFSGRSLKYEFFESLLGITNAVYYVYMCTTGDADTMTDEMNMNESDPEIRDFTGLDFTAWIYDLNRPHENYSDRGVHPTGTGIDRYIRYSDLTSEEKNYLKFSSRLAFLNFISPQLFGISRFTASLPFSGREFSFNFMMTHQLTSFGNDISAVLFFTADALKTEVAYHSYLNCDNYFPGIEFIIRRFPISIYGKTIYMDTRMLFFIQPQKHEFRTRDGEAGGLAGIGFYLPLAGDRLELFMEGDVKSSGWVAGNVYLDRAIQQRTGISFYF